MKGPFEIVTIRQKVCWSVNNEFVVRLVPSFPGSCIVLFVQDPNNFVDCSICDTIMSRSSEYLWRFNEKVEFLSGNKQLPGLP